MAALKQPIRNETQLQELVYSDLKTNFEVHPNKKDVTRDFNEDAVKRSIRNIILTIRGERLMNPLYGSDINSMLFENMTPATEEILKEHITTAITNFEPRAKLVGVTVSALFDYNAYAVSIVFSTINTKEPVTVEFLINRIR